MALDIDDSDDERSRIIGKWCSALNILIFMLAAATAAQAASENGAMERVLVSSGLAPCLKMPPPPPPPPHARYLIGKMT